jgi:transcription-repair coupling factor (superfamily II helicase)
MLESLTSEIYSSGPFERLKGYVRSFPASNELSIGGLYGSLTAFVVSLIFEHSDKNVLVIVPEREDAEKLRDDCAILAETGSVLLCAHNTSHRTALHDLSAPLELVEALSALNGGSRAIVIASAEAIAGKLPVPSWFREKTFQLTDGSEHPFSKLLAQLNELGFERKDFVEHYGDFAVRGGILDVFPFVGDNPIRFEFWGDTIESIREFDILSQRSIRSLQSAAIVPSLFGEQAVTVEFTHSLFDYLGNDAFVFCNELPLIHRNIEETTKEFTERYFRWETLEGILQSYPRILHSNLVGAAKNDIAFNSLPQPPVDGIVKILVKELEELAARGSRILLTCDTKDESSRLHELIEEERTTPDSAQEKAEAENEYRFTDELPISILNETFHSGFIYPAINIALITEHEVFGRLKRRGGKRRGKIKGITAKEIAQLKRGDFVVHEDYGIGVFAGLQRLKTSGGEQEVMKVQYAEGDTLYVNLNYVNRIQKFSSQEGHVPKLTRLGTAQWERIKSRAKKRIKDIARDLIALYAKRKLMEGFSFAPDTHWQKEMEASFMYEDTPDQARTTREVKEDMERPAPMDRLICGDVGFGKTEVAVRAAFKTVMNTRQAAVLVPTTILAVQHFNTFRDRIGRYGVRVEMLSRFRTKKEQNEVLIDLKEGKVDVIIGTHRLISKDVEFKSLGLLVIDEEHRFGVQAKEKLRQFRANVDTLSMTATPIPRTLQFSLMGARDLSIISTPPNNRLPIETEIAKYDMPLIREAILKEVKRGGQVYVIHDRVENIEVFRRMLEDQVPEAKFHTAHGQMDPRTLEKTMVEFLEKKYDVLVCTKIIESGIDIPSVNTIIINRADRFGLAELYQLRGRVGRSNEQAYAYLLVPSIHALPRQSLRRLQAIQEFTELGSGFNLAMRDLEIRGAGNLLGAEQSGFIMEMGIEMYQRIMEEAVEELKNVEFAGIFDTMIKETPKKSVETQIESDLEAYIPELYIENDPERLDIYRRLYKMASDEEIDDLKKELIDRFGEFSEEVTNLFDIVSLKLLASRIGFVKVQLMGKKLTLLFPSPETTEFYDSSEERVAPCQRIMERLQEVNRKKVYLDQQEKELRLLAELSVDDNDAQRIAAAKEFIQQLQ